MRCHGHARVSDGAVPKDATCGTTAIDAEAAVKAGNLSAAGEALSVGPPSTIVKALRYTMRRHQ